MDEDGDRQTMIWHEAPEQHGWPEGAIGGLRLAAEGPAILDDEAIIYCRFDALVWKDPTVRPAFPRSVDEPVPGLVALRGPGRLSLAGAALGEMLPLRLSIGDRMLLRSDVIVLASAGLHGIAPADGDPPFVEPDLAVFEATEEALALLLATGSIFEADLAADDSVDVARRALLYADASVSLEAVEESLSEGLALAMIRCSGPGRIGMQTVIAGA
jgi:hypothetical protein